MQAFKQLEAQAIRDKQLQDSFNNKVIFKHVSKQKEVDLQVVNLIDIDNDTNDTNDDDDLSDNKTQTFRQQLGQNLTTAETTALLQEAVTQAGSNISPPAPGPLQQQGDDQVPR